MTNSGQYIKRISVTQIAREVMHTDGRRYYNRGAASRNIRRKDEENWPY